MTHNFLLCVNSCKDMYFLATVLQDSPPLLVIEFLYRVVDVFSDYFQDLSERAIKENFVTVYQVIFHLLFLFFSFSPIIFFSNKPPS